MVTGLPSDAAPVEASSPHAVAVASRPRAATAAVAAVRNEREVRDMARLLRDLERGEADAGHLLCAHDRSQERSTKTIKTIVKCSGVERCATAGRADLQLREQFEVLTRRRCLTAAAFRQPLEQQLRGQLPHRALG